jgi:hypothetical protein
MLPMSHWHFKTVKSVSQMSLAAVSFDETAVH